MLQRADVQRPKVQRPKFSATQRKNRSSACANVRTRGKSRASTARFKASLNFKTISAASYFHAACAAPRWLATKLANARTFAKCRRLFSLSAVSLTP
jgi:hypothetical protein